MTLKRVGREVDAAAYWAERGSTYQEGMNGAYHAHRLAVIGRLLEAVPTKNVSCLDFGCDDGAVSELLARRGARVLGIEPDARLSAAARRRVEPLRGRIVTAGLGELRDIRPASIDLLLALNVAAYFTDDEDRAFYEQASRILRPGGARVVTHSNELFDLYTLNAYTVELIPRHFCGRESRPAIATLLTHPHHPERTTFNIRENPLRYRHKLSAWGFEEVQQEFANLHPLPPLLMDPRGFADIDARTYDDTLNWPPEERWKLLFLCSMYGSRSVRR